MAEKGEERKILISKNRADTMRKYVVFNYEFRGNHILMRQVNQE